MTKPRTLTREEELHLQAWRVTALDIAPYFASALFALTPLASTSVHTFSVDSRMRLYINFETCVGMGPRFCGEALLHEVGHVLGEHNGDVRKLAGVQPHEAMDWNYATDASINDDLRDAGCTEVVRNAVLPETIGMPDHLTPLDYMAQLRRLRQQQASQQPEQGGDDQDDDGDEDSQSGPQGQQQGQGQQQPGQSGQGSQQPQQGGSGQDDDGGGGGQGSQQPQPLFQGCGSASGGPASPDELDEDDDLGGQAPGLDEVEQFAVKVATAAAIENHVAAHGIGSVPGSWQQVVEDVRPAPKATPWERLLSHHMRRAVSHTLGNTDTSYTRRNRRRMHDELVAEDGASRGRLVVPGNIRPVPNVHFYRDTSGSMSDEQLAAVTAEVESISRRLGIRGDDLKVTDVDVVVHSTRKFTGAKSIAKVEGRGGTDMGAAIADACSRRRRPSCIVVATDGETGWPQAKPPVPVVVLLAGASPYWVDRVPSWAAKIEVPSA